MSYRSRAFVPFLLLVSVFALAPHALAATGQVHVSKNWAGFGAGNASYTGVRATWVVPRSTSVGRGISADAEWIGIGGAETTDLIQAGTQTIFIDGKPQYQAWYETLPDVQRSLPIPITPGDTVSVSLTETFPNVWHLTFTDTTTGASYNADILYVSNHSSAEWIVERPLAVTNKGTSYLSLADFDTVTFTNAAATVNGVETPIERTNAEPVVMSPTSSTVSAAPGSLGSGSFILSYLTPSEGRTYLRAFNKVYRGRRPAPLAQPAQTPAQSVPADGTFVIRIFF